MSRITQVVLYGSTIALWSIVLACIMYSLRKFPAPLKESITPEQREIKIASAKVRGQFFYSALVVSVLVVGAIVIVLAKSD